MFLDPGQESFHRMPVGSLRMLVAQRAEEEFLGGEYGIGASAVDDVGEGLRESGGKIPSRRGESGGLSHGLFPGVQESDAKTAEIFPIAGDRPKVMLKRRRREQTVRRRYGDSLASRFGGNGAPPVGNGGVDGKNPALKAPGPLCVQPPL